MGNPRHQQCRTPAEMTANKVPEQPHLRRGVGRVGVYPLRLERARVIAVRRDFENPVAQVVDQIEIGRVFAGRFWGIG